MILPVDVVATQPLLLCAILLAAPFLQEDAALLTGATAAAMHPPVEALGILAAPVVGLTLCALVKYALGATVARTTVAQRANVGAMTAGRMLLRRLGVSIVTARFVPGTRIPLYVACGGVRAPLGKFAGCVALSGAAYISVVWLIVERTGALAT